MDALVGEIVAGTDNPLFDFTGDGFVDPEDLDEWLALAGAENLPSGNPYLPGDANLDGNVDASDFNRWNANKFTSVAEWCRGDFTADGNVDASDFNRWNANKFTSALDGGTVPVPEPSGWILVVWLAAAIPLGLPKGLTQGAEARSIDPSTKFELGQMHLRSSVFGLFTASRSRSASATYPHGRARQARPTLTPSKSSPGRRVHSASHFACPPPAPNNARPSPYRTRNDPSQ